MSEPLKFEPTGRNTGIRATHKDPVSQQDPESRVTGRVFEIRPAIVAVWCIYETETDRVIIDRQQAIELAKEILRYYGVTEDA